MGAETVADSVKFAAVFLIHNLYHKNHNRFYYNEIRRDVDEQHCTEDD